MKDMNILLPIATLLPAAMMIAAVVLPLAWLYSELDGARWVRILLGLLSIILATFVVSEMRLIIPSYTTNFHHFSISRATDLLKEGQTDAVIEAFDQYMADSTNSVRLYNPAMALSNKLSKMKKRDIEQKFEHVP
jgi:hypothetical protein